MEYTASDGKLYKTGFYNLDAILSVGYRVNSKNATHFRRWANRILEEHSKKIDFFIRTSLPPVEGIFFDGQIYDAYAFISGLVRCAEKYIILIDNYIDDTVLTILDKRKDNVDATIYTSRITKDTSLDIRKHNMQYRPIQVREFRKAHDIFLIIDDKVYLIGASIKDLGKKWFGFTLMENISAEDIIKHLQSTQ